MILTILPQFWGLSVGHTELFNFGIRTGPG